MADSFHDPPPSYEVATTPTSSAASLAPDIADAVLVFYIPMEFRSFSSLQRDM
jgi:hypothetical protein